MTQGLLEGGPSVIEDGPDAARGPERKGPEWKLFFFSAGISDGRPIEILAILDGQTRECLAILVEHDIGSQEVTDWLLDLFVLKGPPECIRSGNAPLPLANAIRDWLSNTRVKTQFVKREKSRQSDRAESFGRRLRDDVIDRKTLADLPEAKTTIEGWRKLYNQTRLPEPTDGDATTCRIPTQQSCHDDSPDPSQALHRRDTLQSSGSQSVRSHDPLRVEAEPSQSVQHNSPPPEIETSESVQRQAPLVKVEPPQSKQSQVPLDAIGTGQSVESLGALGAIETGQSIESVGSLDAIGTGQSVESPGATYEAESGQPLQRDDHPDEIVAGQSVQRLREIDIGQPVRHEKPVDAIVARKSVQSEEPSQELGSGSSILRQGPLTETETNQSVRRQGPHDEIVTGQSAQHQVSVDDEAGAGRRSRSRRAVAAVMGLVAPSLRPAPSRHHGRPTIREMKKTAVRMTEWVGIAIVILLVAVVALTLIAPYFGWRVDTVRSGSMEPELKVGSVVITRPVRAEEIGVGDVITFYSPTNGEITSHRVSAIEDGPSFRTEAIANEDADPFVTPAQGVVGRVCFDLPFAGYIIQHLVTPVGILLLFLFGFSIVASEMISMFQVRWKRPD